MYAYLHVPGRPKPLSRGLDGEEEVKMLGRPFGVILLAATLLTAGVAGIAAFSVAFLTRLMTSGYTSPLVLFVTLAWSCTFVTAAVLTWRGSRRAPPAFLAATAFLLVVLSFIFQRGQLLLLLLGVIFLSALFVYGYLRRASESAV